MTTPPDVHMGFVRHTDGKDFFVRVTPRPDGVLVRIGRDDCGDWTQVSVPIAEWRRMVAWLEVRRRGIDVEEP